jgi:hypothetical protein
MSLWNVNDFPADWSQTGPVTLNAGTTGLVQEVKRPLDAAALRRCAGVGQADVRAEGLILIDIVCRLLADLQAGSARDS